MAEMEYDVSKAAGEALNAIQEHLKNLKHLNIAVIGRSGVGKSTLINSVFRDDLAETGTGTPVTQDFKKISKDNYPLSIWDTPGFELGSDKQKEIMAQLVSIIKDGAKSSSINDRIHCIWYCINTASNRVEPMEIEWIREFTNENKITNVPVIIVLTKSFQKSDARTMKEEIEKENLDVKKVVPVLAQDIEINDEYIAKAYGLETLVTVMGEVLPNELQRTLQNVQNVSLKAKRKAAQAVIATSVAAAFGEGFAPVPFSDAALLVPTQLAMIGSITAVYGLEISKGVLTGVISATIGTAGATVLGKTVVTNIIKLIPGFGTVVGGAISGATAGVITTALGEAYIVVMEMLKRGEISADDLSTEKGKKTIADIFIGFLKRKKKLDDYEV